MMMSDSWPRPLANITDDNILTNYGHMYGDYSCACHVTFHTDIVRGYATFDTLLNYIPLVQRPQPNLLVLCEIS